MTGWAGITWVDWAFAALLLVSTLVGVLRGLVFELMSLAGWVLAYLAAHAFSPLLAPTLPFGAPASAVRLVVAFTLVFIGTLIVWSLVSWLIKKLVQASPLKPLDRLLGAAFGILRGVLVALVVATLVRLTPLAKSLTWQASRGAQALQGVLTELRPRLPDEVARHLPV